MSPTLAPAGKKATVLVTSGLFRTAAGAVGQRLLESHAQELREYLTIRMGSIKGGDIAFEELEDELRRIPADQIRRGPNPKARLFLAAAGVAQLRHLLGEDAGERRDVPWAPIPPTQDPDYREAIELIRTTLPASDAEVLELHHVRELEVSDVAYVIGVREATARERLKSAEAYAAMLVEERMGTRAAPLDKILVDAYSLDPLPERQVSGKEIPPALGSGTVLAERYELMNHVAAGAFGHVYKARDVLVPGHTVALKLLHRPARSPAAHEGAIRELSLIASVFHPSIVQFKDHGWFEERLWFVMPWYDGETLQERMDRQPMTPAEAWPIFEKLSLALGALHNTGIRHQDVKPDNIFLVNMHAGDASAEPEILPVLLDLGVAAPSGDMALAGTPIYFAPEVAVRFVDTDSEAALTDRADVFALALTLMHALDPSSATDDCELEFDDFVKLRAERLPALSKARTVRKHRKRLARWMSFDSRERPSAHELADELRELSRGRRYSRSARPSVFRRAAIGVAAAGVAAGVALGAAVPVDGWADRGEDDVTRAERRVVALERQVQSADERASHLEAELTTLRAEILRVAAGAAAPVEPDAEEQ